MGLVGAFLGSAAGLLFGAGWHEGAGPALAGPIWLSAPWWLAVITGAPLIAALAGWLPSFLAAQQDPAVVLSRE